LWELAVSDLGLVKDGLIVVATGLQNAVAAAAAATTTTTNNNNNNFS
jgi:hypothetical protein